MQTSEGNNFLQQQVHIFDPITCLLNTSLLCCTKKSVERDSEKKQQKNKIIAYSAKCIKKIWKKRSKRTFVWHYAYAYVFQCKFHHVLVLERQQNKSPLDQLR